MNREQPIDVSEIWSALHQVEDPELPSLSITDLGIVRSVELLADSIRVGLSPTYSGCPATDTIAADVDTALRTRWRMRVEVRQILSPPWTTDWITQAGHEKLRLAGISPPLRASTFEDTLCRRIEMACPRCLSTDTLLVSEFGSTPCKAAFVCESCLEPFEYFKCL